MAGSPAPIASRMARALLAGTVALALLGGCGGSDTPPAGEVRVRVGTVGLDPRVGTPVVLLEEEDGGRALPIWIGFPEAESIALEMDKRKAPRPNTHDLAKRVLDELGSRVVRVVVTELHDGTYYALLVLRTDGRTVEVDARPSDAIALALRFDAPVYVRERLFEATPDGGGRPGAPERRASVDGVHPRGTGSATAAAPV